MNELTKVSRRNWFRAADFDLDDSSVPSSSYTSQEQFDLERERVFRRAWLSVARVEELPAAGDFIHREILPLKTKRLLVRGDDGAVRGFHTSFSPPGARFGQEAKGTTPTLH